MNTLIVSNNSSFLRIAFRHSLRPSNAAIALSMGLLLGACATRSPMSQTEPTEFVFAAGTLRDGKITVNPGVKVQQDAPKGAVMLLPANGGAIGIKCSCILEAGGSCFPDSTNIGGDTTTVVCVSNGCGPGGAPFCLMEIDDLDDDGTSTFNFKAVVKAVRAAQ